MLLNPWVDMSCKQANQRPYLELTYELEKRSSISTRFANLRECESGFYCSPTRKSVWTQLYVIVWGRGEEERMVRRITVYVGRWVERRRELCQFWTFVPTGKVLIPETHLLSFQNSKYNPFQTQNTMNSLILVNLVPIKDIWLIYHIHIGHIQFIILGGGLFVY